MERISIAGEKQVDKTRRKKRIKFLLAVLAIFCIIGLFLFSGIFSLKDSKITINGASPYVDMDKIVSNIIPSVNWNLMLINDKNMKEDIENIAGVTDVNIIKKWPDSLIVNIKSLPPVLQLKTSEGFTPLDETGGEMLLQKTQIENVPEYVLGKDEKYNQEVAKDVAKIANVVLRKIGSHNMVFSAKNSDSITFKLDGKYNVVLGDNTQADLKASDIVTIISNPQVLDGKLTIDVSFPRRPIIK